MATIGKELISSPATSVEVTGWEGVYKILKNDGFKVAVVQNPTKSLDDVAFTKRVIAAQGGPVVLVGHSYGGAVITEAGKRSQRRDSRLYCGVRFG